MSNLMMLPACPEQFLSNKATLEFTLYVFIIIKIRNNINTNRANPNIQIILLYLVNYKQFTFFIFKPKTK